MMRINLLIYCLLVGIVSLSGQQNRGLYKLEIKDESLKEILHQLEQTYDLLFSFKEDDISEYVLTKNISTPHLQVLMESVLEGTGLGHQLVDEKFILISPFKEVTICGKVQDEEGYPLIGASINVSNTNVGTITDEEGRFELKHLFVNEQAIDLRYLGYQTLSREYEFFQKAECPTVFLKLGTNELQTLFITDYITDGISLNQNENSTSLRPDKMGALPGQPEPDILKSIQFLPGISSPSSRTSDIYIRGGTPDQNLILWEHIPIYHTAHYFGMISAFDPFNVQSMEVFRGGFGAEYGGRVSGVIDLQAVDNSEGTARFRAGANMTHGFLNGILQVTPGTTLSYSARRSYADILETPSFKNLTRFNQQGFIIGNKELSRLPDHVKVYNDFTFIDSQLKFSSQLSHSDKIEIAGIYTNNDFSDEIIDAKKQEGQRDSMLLNNLGFSLDWQHLWSDKLSTSLKIIGTTYDYDYDYTMKETGETQPRISGVKMNGIKDRQLSLSSILNLENNDSFVFGYELVDYDIDFRVMRDIPGRNQVNTTGDSSSKLHSIHLSHKRPIGNSFGWNVGLRSSYYGLTESIYLEPRVRLSYKLDENLQLSANYGRHHQFVGQVTEFRGSEGGLDFPQWALAEDKSIPVQQADLYQFGLVYQKSSWVIDVQAYIKNVKGLSSSAFELFGVSPNDGLIGSSESQGFDLLIKKRFRHFSSWLSYSLAKSELLFGRRNVFRFPTDYDQRHIVQWVNQVKFSNSLELAIGYKISSGLPYSYLEDFKVEDVMNNLIKLNYEGINNRRLPNMKEVNLSAKYQLFGRGRPVKGYLSCSIVNLLNKNNIFERNYFVDARPDRPPIREVQEKSNLPFTPNMSFWMEWH